jgi:hypothetical protein
MLLTISMLIDTTAAGAKQHLGRLAVAGKYTGRDQRPERIVRTNVENGKLDTLRPALRGSSEE